MSFSHFRPCTRGASRLPESHSNLLKAIRHLEDALACPAPTREREWGSQVLEHLNQLANCLVEHIRDVEAPDGLYQEMVDEMPNAAQRVGYLRDTNRNLLDRSELLMREVRRVAIGEGGAFMAVRMHTAELMNELRQQQSREVDLVFEACNRDTGQMD